MSPDESHDLKTTATSVCTQNLDSEKSHTCYLRFDVRVFCPGGGGGGHSLVSSVPMRDQKNDEKGYFFQEGQCAALTSFRVGKMSFLWKKGVFLQFC